MFQVNVEEDIQSTGLVALEIESPFLALGDAAVKTSLFRCDVVRYVAGVAYTAAVTVLDGSTSDGTGYFKGAGNVRSKEAFTLDAATIISDGTPCILYVYLTPYRETSTEACNDSTTQTATISNLIVDSARLLYQTYNPRLRVADY